MLRLLRRLGHTVGPHPIFSCPDAGPGARPLSPNLTPIGGFEPAPQTPFVNGTGLKPSLTLFLLFMECHGQAP
jgi:hypothetical protein